MHQYRVEELREGKVLPLGRFADNKASGDFFREMKARMPNSYFQLVLILNHGSKDPARPEGRMRIL